jgi:hypothetical protein
MGSGSYRHLRGFRGAFLLAVAACSGSDLTSPSTGGLQVSAATSGEAADLDPDGYSIAVDGGAGQTLPISGLVTIGQLAPGAHTVVLGGVAANCTVLGQNPVSVIITAGATAEIAFRIMCSPTSAATGSLEVTAATTGDAADLDPDGYMAAVDGGARQPLAVNGTVTFSQLAPGTHTVALDRIAPNCTISGDNPVVDTIAVGTSARTTFQIACGPLTPSGPPPALAGRIAFVSDRDGNNEIYVMKADGTGVTRLTNNLATDRQPTWSPDGKKIAFVSNRAGNDEIYVMNADGTSVTRLTNSADIDRDPAWSPNGAKIAFASNRAGHFEIYVMNANGSSLKRLTTNLPFQTCGGASIGQEILPTWSPGGGKIAFRHKTTCFSAAIEIMNADGTGVTQLTDARSALKLAWGPTGRIVFDGRVWPTEGLSDGEIAVVTVNGATVTRLTSNTAEDEYPTWSPAGAAIAFASNRDSNFELYAMNPDGSGVTRLTRSPGSDSEPAWGP